MTETSASGPGSLNIRSANAEDCGTILKFIEALAEYEHLSHEVEATEEKLRRTLFGDTPSAEVVIAEWNGAAAGIALFFTTYSTFLARPGIYLEDLFVDPRFRHQGIGSALLSHLAQLVIQREGGRLEWSVLNWNEPAIQLYRSRGSVPLDEWTVHRVSGDALEKLASRKPDAR